MSEGPWPELVGLPADEAVKRIQTANPALNVLIVPEGSAVTRDFRVDRVRVYADSEGKVAREPKRG